MGLFDSFSRWFKSDAPEPARPKAAEPSGPLVTLYDESLDLPLSRARNAASQGDVGPATALLTETQDPDQRADYLRGIAKAPGRPAWMDLWVAREGERSALPWLVRGRHAIDWAWEARSRARAHDVSEEQFRQFFERLRLAEHDLGRAAELAPDDPLPHAEGVVVAMGLQQPLEVRRACFERAVERAPHHFIAHHALLVALCEKWGGSHEAMFAHVRSARERAPDGSRLHALIAWAHAERWLYFSFAEEPDFDGRDAYMSSPAVIEELETAWARGPAHPSHPGGWALVHDANVFAFDYYTANDGARARDALLRTGGCCTALPWGWRGDPTAHFGRACAAVAVTSFAI